MPRISWSPDGERLLISDRGVLRIVDTSGVTVRQLAPRQVRLGTAPGLAGEPLSLATANFLDGHWLHDGRIAAIDIFGIPVQFTMRGDQYGDPPLPPNPWRVESATLSGDGQEIVISSDNRLIAYTGSERKHRWELLERARWYGMGTGRITHTALSHDGRQLALGCTFEYRTPEGADLSWKHGWFALDLKQKPIERSGSWRATVLGRGYSGEVTQLIFDRTARRLLVSTATGAGVVRLVAEKAQQPAHAPIEKLNEPAEPARCAALDDRGLRAVYGYAGRSELRIDYLSPRKTDDRLVEILDQHRIDAGIEPVALALDAGGSRIGCLGTDGRVEIVPVP